MTGRQTAVLGVCAILAAAGMIAGAALWMTAAVAVAAVVVLAGYVANDWSRGVTARRVRPAGGDSIEVAIGSNVPVEIEVQNNGRLPVAWVLAEDTLPRRLDGGTRYRPPMDVDGPSLAVMTLGRGESESLAYNIPCRRRGYFEVGPTVLETGDPLGLFRRFRVDPATATVTVLPKVVRLGDYQIGSRRPIGEIRIRDNAIVDPTRIRGIRRWQIGDPLRSVHWAATARTGVLHSKQYESSSIIGATVLLDLHVTTNPDAMEPHRGDLAITAAASICAALHEMGEPFAMATNGRDAAERIRTDRRTAMAANRSEASAAARTDGVNDRLRPIVTDVGRDEEHFKSILRTLARLERTDGLTLAEMLIESRDRISSETTLIVVLQKAPAESLQALLQLHNRGREVAVIINTADLTDFESIAAPLIDRRIAVSHLDDEDRIAELCRAAVGSR